MSFNFDANCSLFPASIKDFFGLKDLKANYDLVCTAFAVGDFILKLTLSQMIAAATGTFNTAYVTVAILLAISALR